MDRRRYVFVLSVRLCVRRCARPCVLTDGATPDRLAVDFSLFTYLRYVSLLIYFAKLKLSMYGFHVFKVFQSPKIRDFLRFLSCCTRFPERWLRPMTPPAVRQLARSTKHTISGNRIDRINVALWVYVCACRLQPVQRWRSKSRNVVGVMRTTILTMAGLWNRRTAGRQTSEHHACLMPSLW